MMRDSLLSLIDRAYQLIELPVKPPADLRAVWLRDYLSFKERAEAIQERRDEGTQIDRMEASQEAAHYDWLDRHCDWQAEMLEGAARVLDCIGHPATEAWLKEYKKGPQ